MPAKKSRAMRAFRSAKSFAPLLSVSGFPSAWPVRTISARILRALAREGRLRAGDRVLLSISGVGEREMTRLNFKHRRLRVPTDVLSFEQKGARAPRGVRFLGDLVLCLPVVRAQAKEHGHGVRAELAVLVTHGVLHLLGFDHERSTRAAKKMGDLELRILGRAGLLTRAHAKGKP